MPEAPMTRWEFVRLGVLSSALGLTIAFALYTRIIHPYLDSIGACQCHDEQTPCEEPTSPTSGSSQVPWLPHAKSTANKLVRM